MDSEKKYLINVNNKKSRGEEITFDQVPFYFGYLQVLCDLVAAIWASYFIIYFHVILGFDYWQTGVWVFVGQFASSAGHPIVASLICKYGKNRAWYVLGYITILITAPLFFTGCINCEESEKSIQLIYYSILQVIFQLGLAVTQISHLALISKLARDRNEQEILITTRYYVQMVLNVFIYSFAYMVTQGSEGYIGQEDASKFHFVLGYGLVLGIIAAISSPILLYRYSLYKKIRGDETIQNQTSLETLSNFEQYKVAVIYVTTMLFVNLTQILMPFYINETLNMGIKSVMGIPAVVSVGCLGLSCFKFKLNEVHGKDVYAMGSVVGFVACAWIYIRSEIPIYTSAEIYVVALLLGIASSFLLITNLRIVLNIFADNPSSGVYIYSILCCLDKVTTGTAVYLIQSMHYFFESNMYYGNVFTFVCGLVLILILLITTSIGKKKQNYKECSSIP